MRLRTNAGSVAAATGSSIVHNVSPNGSTGSTVHVALQLRGCGHWRHVTDMLLCRACIAIFGLHK